MIRLLNLREMLAAQARLAGRLPQTSSHKKSGLRVSSGATSALWELPPRAWQHGGRRR